MHASEPRRLVGWTLAIAFTAASWTAGDTGPLASGDARRVRPSAAEQEEIGPFPKTGLFSVFASGTTGLAGTADDPAIWVHPTNPALSVVIGTNKNTSGGLHIFDLQGNQLQFVAGGKHNNVDVRYGFPFGGTRVDLVSACDRNNNTIDIYTINPATRALTQAGTIQSRIDVYGYAMYHSRTTDKYYALVASGDGLEQWELVDRGGSIGGVLVRTIPLTTTVEGIVADDELGDLYLAEESTGIYKYRADPGQGNARVTVDLVGSSSQLVEDVEGLAIYYRPNGTGYLIASSQGNNRFTVYRREAPNAYLGTFRIADGPLGDANDTDGIDVINMPLGSLYPLGLFVAQNDDRDFKMVAWEDIAAALGLAIHSDGYDVRGAGCGSVAGVVVAPPSANVEVGASLQLVATAEDSEGSPLTGCSVTWSATPAGIVQVDDNGLVSGLSEGDANVTATIGGEIGSASITVTPSTNNPPVAEAGGDLASLEGAAVQLSGASFSDADATDVHTATIDWGDGSAVQAANVNQAAGTITGSHVYANDGQFTVTVTVRDNRGGVDLDTTAVGVGNVLPAANPGGPYSGVEGGAISFAGTAVDPGADTLVFEWDFAFDGSFDVNATGAVVSHIYPQDGTYTVALRVQDDDGVSPVVTTSAVIAERPPVALYLTLASSATVGGVSVANEDILAFSGTGFSLFFDGSDVGLSSAVIDAFSVIGPTEVLLSFTEPRSVAGISGTVDDSDIVRFTATSLGPSTAGTFAMFFDGSDVGLTNSSEDVDAIERLPDGRLIVSMTGSFSVTGASGVGQDLAIFTPTSLGATTAGSWTMYVDGSDVGLSSSDENLDAVAVDASGRIYLSTTGSYSVSRANGADEDVFVFTPTQLGATTAGTFSSTRFFDGSLFGLGSNDVVAIDIP
jgi:3-phytase